MTTPPPGPPPLLNIANVLTGLRLVLVPVFLAALLTDGGTNTGWRLVASGVFALAAITDRFDGELARSRGLVTAFGTIADPIADKALMGAALIGLSILGQLPWWVTIVIMVREVGITLLRFSVLRHGIIPASRGGKAKTLVQTVAIGLYVLPLVELTGGSAVVEPVRVAVMAVAIALTVITGFDYILRAARLRSTSTAA
ncbi:MULTISPECIES: CDP-diacylglycerol--glycerol-3-phosphate 3-phosphatidyltransferase [unclassified Pseudonocardia]|uniref:CDP-diacylglycerol--glycerol-3-phosphate 3-phosphatidyltransferase n=1 Tax=unclassified Pseudonocardia TaxID=2619320 RepID=UPI0009599512|nr:MULTISPECIES: CDP-diacylglycerol--glycerol-3-phosphate 3-phosphatidyltransferase [unclassified Pseudonocardia]MBN9099480.1 CDP-diacylglycerol--glycerol-3-phosphate 3-phosphatidyltransferase [Pseudonocardia sp.]OJY48657.1 MAG: CDP-diacylglycerol--glycerol-3-phosphate 3-phosphatidyltransferase [Pseudonocardia sp. 73-21]